MDIIPEHTKNLQSRSCQGSTTLLGTFEWRNTDKKDLNLIFNFNRTAATNMGNIKYFCLAGIKKRLMSRRVDSPGWFHWQPNSQTRNILLLAKQRADKQIWLFSVIAPPPPRPFAPPTYTCYSILLSFHNYIQTAFTIYLCSKVLKLRRIR